MFIAERFLCPLCGVQCAVFMGMILHGDGDEGWTVGFARPRVTITEPEHAFPALRSTLSDVRPDPRVTGMAGIR